MTAGYVSYQLTFLPGLNGLSLTLGHNALMAGSPLSVTVPVLRPLQAAVLMSGLGFALGVLWRRWGEDRWR